VRVLVTGGAGFIGSHTVDALVARGDEITVIDNLSKPVHLKGKPSYLNPGARFVEGDIRDRELMTQLLGETDAVIHLAAYQDYLPDFSTFFSVNAVGTALIYELIVQHKFPIRRVVVATSQAVNGEGQYECVEHGIMGVDSRPLEQLDRGDWEIKCPLCGKAMQWQWTSESYSHPENQYALSKQSQEQIAMSFGKKYDIPSVCMRYSIVQGPRQSFYNAYSGACRIFSLHYYFKKAPTIYEDGLMRRDFININDVVRANLQALDDDRMIGEQYNVGGGKDHTVLEFARLVAMISGVPELEPKIPGAFRYGDTRHSCSDTSKLQALGWSPKYTAEDSVQAYVSWLREHSDVEDIFEYAERNMKAMNVVREVNQKLARG
jgi:dTDP-L-rhamnose 4-epimerase